MIFYNNSEYSDCEIIFCSCFRVFVLACFLFLPFVAHVPASEVLKQGGKMNTTQKNCNKDDDTNYSVTVLIDGAFDT